MCGACAGPPADWAAPLVAGPRRREHVARFLDAATRGVQVRTSGRGWRITRPTGGVTVASSLDDAVGAAAAHATVRTWAEAEHAVRRIEAAVGHAADDRGDSTPPRAPGAGHGCEHGAALRTPRVVLSAGAGTLSQVRLAAFCLGVRAFDDAHVALEVTGRRSPFRLLAAHGRILGTA